MGIFNNPARDEQGNELRRRRTDQIPFSIIASDMTVIGDLETEGVVRVEGRVKGTVRVGAQVLVAVGAVIEGDLHTQEAVVAGQVSGTIVARERVELQATAVVSGRHPYTADRDRRRGQSQRRSQNGRQRRAVRSRGFPQELINRPKLWKISNFVAKCCAEWPKCALTGCMLSPCWRCMHAPRRPLHEPASGSGSSRPAALPTRPGTRAPMPDSSGSMTPSDWPSATSRPGRPPSRTRRSDLRRPGL